MDRSTPPRDGSPSTWRRRAGRWIAGGALVLVALVVGLVVVGAFAYAPCGAAVDGNVVRVERRWARPIELPLAQIRSATRLSAEDAQGWSRRNGVALGRVGYGRYASPRLGDFRLYAWRRGTPVLLETTEGRVVLTPEDPDALVADVSAGLRP